MRADYIGCVASPVRALFRLLLVLVCWAATIPGGLAQHESLGALRFTLDSLPQQEIWAGLTLGGEKIGYSHTTVRQRTDGRYDILTESVLLLRMLGFESLMEARTRDIVRADLTLDRFEAEFLMNGNRLKVEGRASTTSLALTLDNAGNRIDRNLEYSGSLYPASVVGFYAPVYGIEPGRAVRFAVFNPQSLQIGPVEQHVKANDPADRFAGLAYEISTRMEGQDSILWLDRNGRFLLEEAMNGSMAAIPESEPGAKAYLSAARLNSRDLVAGLSLVRADRTLDHPDRMARMEIELTGVDLPLASGPGQRCKAHDGVWHCELASGLFEPFDGDVAGSMASSLTVTASDARIIRLAKEITADARSDEQKLRAILRWLEANIRQEAADGFSALDVLSSRRAECQGHTYLYSALARSSGIPTRVANGLVYSADHGGFLYHTWAESLVDGQWRAVDPTFGQLIADATHVKIIEGEEYADVAPIVNLIGKVGAKIRSYEYRRE
ncbi:MAG TPA: transglutaminase-like domain-containing protein [Burkholderiales bacterium]|nr:transglutaminase-like domain-containing protein [Burkholderiales bacterium]